MRAREYLAWLHNHHKLRQTFQKLGQIADPDDPRFIESLESEMVLFRIDCKRGFAVLC